MIDRHPESKAIQTPPRKITHLALGGGGWRAMYATGVLSVLRREGILKDVENVAVASGGCVPGFSLALGYDTDQSMQFMEEHVLNDKYPSSLVFIPEHIDSDASPYYKIEENDSYLKSAGKRILNAGIFCYLFMKNIKDAYQSNGIFHPKGFELLWRLIKHSPVLPPELKKTDLTFAELHQFKINHPQFYMADLYVAATDITHGDYQLKYYSYEETPDVPILTAASGSMAIPVIFRQVEENGRILRDGGLVNNVPRDAFDKPPFFKPQDRLTDMNMRTLAVCFSDSDDSTAQWRDNLPTNQGALSTWIIRRLLGAVAPMKHLDAQDKVHQEGANALRTLYLNSSGISRLRPTGLTSKKYESINAYVENETTQYINNYLRTIDPHAPLETILALPDAKNFYGFFNVTPQELNAGWAHVPNTPLCKNQLPVSKLT